MFSLTLTNEIRKLQKESFPELNWIFLSGSYLSLEKLNCGGRVIYSGIGKKSKPLTIGFALIQLPDYLAGVRNYNPRKGILAHELGHLITAQSRSEYDADLAAIDHGLGKDLYRTLKERENLGISRHTGYNSEQILSMLNSP